MKIVKRNKRLVLIDQEEIKYSPPDHIRDYIHSREEMSKYLINNSDPLIERIRNFERVVWDRFLKKKHHQMFR